MCSVVLGGVPVITPPKVNTLNTLYMYLEIEVYWAEDEWEKKEDLGMDIESNLGTIFLNTNHIVAHHPNDEGDTMIRMVNGEIFRSPIYMKTLRGF